MSEPTQGERVPAAVASVAARAGGTAETGIILGGGLGGLADGVEAAVTIPYGEIAGFPVPTAPGHAGLPVLGLSAITNAATGGPEQRADTIEPILASAAIAGKTIAALLAVLLSRL